MAYTVSKLIKIVEAEVGYMEKMTNAQLDGKETNVGWNNYTKYARDLHKAGYYNGNKNGFAWCDVFVDWCFYQLCDKNATKAQKMICQTGKLGAGCKFSAQYYRNAGRFYTKPKVGDQIFFGAVGSEKHTGIVYKVDNEKVYTIEGNTREESGVIVNGGGVYKKEYRLDDTQIVGYGRPRYDAEEKKPTTTSNTSKGGKTVTIELTVLRKGAKGEQVKTLQRLLIAFGYDLGSYGADGNFGGKTDTAVRAFQKAKKLTVDGAVGANTWKKLLGAN